MKYLSIIFFCSLAFSCSSQKRTEKSAITPDDILTIPATHAPIDNSIRSHFPRSKPQQSTALYRLLASTGLKPTRKSKSLEAIIAYDTFCEMSPKTNKYKCTLKSSMDKTAKKYAFSEKTSEELSQILFDLPTSQGDTGVSVRFIECTQMNYSSVSHSCDVSINLDYPGP